MIMLQAIACSHGVEPGRNGTALAKTKATLRAQLYSAMLRPSSAVLKAAAIENPRLITALTAVISAQKRNGMFIERRRLLLRFCSHPLRSWRPHRALRRSAGRWRSRFRDQRRSPALLFWSCRDVLGMGCDALPHEIEPIVAEEHFIVDKEGGQTENTFLPSDLIAAL